MDHLAQVYREIEACYLWILLAIGLPGNLLTIATMTSMRVGKVSSWRKLSPATFLVIYLAASDAAAITMKSVYRSVDSH